jgi:hypothetical protein
MIGTILLVSVRISLRMLIVRCIIVLNVVCLLSLNIMAVTINDATATTSALFISGVDGDDDDAYAVDDDGYTIMQ